MTNEERQNWLAERRKGIGGSDVAAILGFSPWNTAVNVWLDKTGRAIDKPENEAMRIGTELEDFVARRYSQETGRQVQRFNKMLHKGCLLGNLDRLVVPEGQKVASHQGEIRTDTLLECKTSSVDWDDGVPLYYQTQVLHYLGLDPNLKHADVACLFLTHKHFEIHRVERDDDMIAAMQERLTEWWEKHVVRGEMPLPSNEEDCRLLWARSNPGKKVTVSSDIRDMIGRYAELKASEKSAKAEAAKLQSDICAFMGDGEILVDVDGRPLVTWKSPKDSETVDWEGLAKALGATDEQVAAFTSTRTGSRRFVLKQAVAA